MCVPRRLTNLKIPLKNYLIQLNRPLISVANRYTTKKYNMKPKGGSLSMNCIHNPILLYNYQKDISKALIHTWCYSNKIFCNFHKHTVINFSRGKSKLKKNVNHIIERENIWTVPNFLCVTRMGLTPIVIYYIVTSQFTVALALFSFAGFTDLIDGIIARKIPGQSSRLGSFLDPLADKILISSIFLSLTYINLIPYPLAGLIILRDFLIMIGAAYVRYQSMPQPQRVIQYFDPTNVSAQLSPTGFSKVNTFVQLSLITMSLCAPVFDFADHEILKFLWFLTATTTVGSGIHYIFSKNTYRYLQQRDKL